MDLKGVKFIPKKKDIVTSKKEFKFQPEIAGSGKG
jgi:hypothetical protein